MATTRKTKTAIEESVDNSVEQTKDAELNEIKKKNEELESTISELKMMMQMLMKQNASSSADTASRTVSKMDTPCTIIHLVECYPDLPDVIKVNGNDYFFINFGEKKVFRFADIQNIITKYRTLFDRGVFMLGSDCAQFQNELPIKVNCASFSDETFTRINKLSEEQLDNLLSSLTQSQCVHIANMWKRNVENGDRSFMNVSKMKIFNKYTENFLKDTILKINQE